MVNRIQYDGGNSFPTLQSPSQASAELGPSPVPADAEIPDIAVQGAAKTFAINAGAQQAPNKHDYTIAKIKMYNTSLADIQAHQQEVQKLRAKLLSGYQHLLEQGVGAPSADNAKSTPDATAAAKQPAVNQPHIKLLGGASAAEASASALAGEQTTGLEANQKAVLDRIQRAIDRVDKIQSQLQGDSGKTAEMLALTTSLDSLTNVQTAVGGADYNSKSAALLVDQIMQNVAAAVASHGNLTSQAVQLALMA
jgi:hypothetical protein